MGLSMAPNSKVFHAAVLLACAGPCSTVALKDLDNSTTSAKCVTTIRWHPTHTSAGDQISFLGLQSLISSPHLNPPCLSPIIHTVL